MRVVHYGPALDDVGGMATAIRDQMSALDESEQISVRHVPTYTANSRWASLRLFFRAVATLPRVVASTDVVHVHLSQGGSFLRKALVVAVASLLRRRVVATVHGSRFKEFAHRRPWLVEQLLGRCDVITVLSRSTLDALIALGSGANAILLPNTVVASPASDVIRADEPVVLFAGEVGRRKGVDVLLEAWAQVVAELPTAKLRIVGPPGDVPVAPLPGVLVEGPVSRSSVIRFIDEAWICVLPSRREAMPMFILEAMTRGCPIVVSDIEDLATVVGTGGLVVPVGDVPALAAAILKGLRNESWRAQAGVAARARVRERHSPEQIRSILMRLYSGGNVHRGTEISE